MALDAVDFLIYDRVAENEGSPDPRRAAVIGTLMPSRVMGLVVSQSIARRAKEEAAAKAPPADRPDETADDLAALLKGAIDKEAADSAAAVKTVVDKAIADKVAESKAALEKAEADRVAADKAAADKAAADKAAADKAAADKAAADKAAEEKAAADKVLADLQKALDQSNAQLQGINQRLDALDRRVAAVEAKLP